MSRGSTLKASCFEAATAASFLMLLYDKNRRYASSWYRGLLSESEGGLFKPLPTNRSAPFYPSKTFKKIEHAARLSTATPGRIENLSSKTSEHPFHLVNPSPWPLFTSLALLVFVLGTVMYLHRWLYGGYILLVGLTFAIYCVSCWWYDVIVEATYEGQHTRAVQSGIRLGMVLFIASEVMFFFAFFWSFFYYSASPSIWIGGVWPPLGIAAPSPWGVPFLNTQILIFSGISLTWAHYSILSGHRQESLNALVITILAGTFFLYFQLLEYLVSPFSMSSGVYGSIFFITTGFHGFHVMLGLVFIIVCSFRQRLYHFTKNHHVGFECASWYWHFVDVVWLFLFITVYWWGAPLQPSLF